MSTTRDPLATAEEYASWVRRTGLADSSQALYTARVEAFCRWLTLTEHGDDYAEVWSDEHVRDWAVRDYRREMLTVRKLAPQTVAGHLAAVGSLFVWHGIGKPRVPGVAVPPSDYKGLSDDEVRRVLRVAEKSGPRDHAIVALGIFAGPRVGEIVPLDLDDVAITERSGVVSIRYGKGGKPRRVPLPPQAREALTAWQGARRSWTGAEACPALFLSKRGDRLAQRSYQHVVHGIGDEAKVALHPHMLRHTFARRWIESGGDVPALSQVLGHRSLRTTAIYAKASWGDLEAQAEALHVDY